MKKRTSFLSALLLLIFPSLVFANYRIAYSADGNQHDPDDHHASVLALAMIAESGNKHRLAHFDFNNHLGDNDWQKARMHRDNVLGAVQRYGYDRSRIFDDQENLWGSVQSMARAINQSSANSRLYLICAGPMEMCYRGIAAADRWKHQFVTVVSHSWWNENHNDTPQLNRRWRDIERDFDVKTVQIADQNHTAFRSSPGAWDWLKWQNHGEWLHRAVARGPGSGDASDAGMVYYVLKGLAHRAQWASMNDIKSMFRGGQSSGDSSASSGGSSGGHGATAPGGHVTLKSRTGNKCVQMANWGKGNGASLEVNNCNGWANQKWRFEQTWGGRHAIRSQHSNKCVRVKGMSSANGARVDQWNCHKGEEEQYDLIARGNGWFSLRAKHSNKCLQTAGGWNGAALQQWSCNGGWNQQFRFD